MTERRTRSGASASLNAPVNPVASARSASSRAPTCPTTPRHQSGNDLRT